jgi:hypothetical protein
MINFFIFILFIEKTLKKQMRKVEKLYKILDKETGLYSKGGMVPDWGKHGKTWNALGHIKSHLRQFMLAKVKDGEKNYRKLVNKIPKTWEVIEIVLEIEIEKMTINRSLAHTYYPKEIDN